MASRKSLRNRAQPSCERLDERALPSAFGFRAALAARMAAAHGPTARALSAQALAAMHAPVEGTIVFSKAPTFTATRFVPHTFSSVTPVASVAVQGNPSIVSGRLMSNITMTRPVIFAVSKPVPATMTPTVEVSVSDPMTRLGSILGALYQHQTTGQPLPISVTPTLLEIEGNSVHVNIRPSADVGSMITAATNAGMTIEAVDPTTGTAEGVIAIDQLVNLASQPEVIAITPVFQPVFKSAGYRVLR